MAVSSPMAMRGDMVEHMEHALRLPGGFGGLTAAAVGAVLSASCPIRAILSASCPLGQGLFQHPPKVASPEKSPKRTLAAEWPAESRQPVAGTLWKKGALVRHAAPVAAAAAAEVTRTAQDHSRRLCGWCTGPVVAPEPPLVKRARQVRGWTTGLSLLAAAEHRQLGLAEDRGSSGFKHIHSVV